MGLQVRDSIGALIRERALDSRHGNFFSLKYFINLLTEGKNLIQDNTVTPPMK